VMVAVTSVIAANSLMFAKWREIPMRVPSENKSVVSDPFTPLQDLLRSRTRGRRRYKNVVCHRQVRVLFSALA
ncbi:hypothetical protein, partial [Pseudomonas amygdali]